MIFIQQVLHISVLCSIAILLLPGISFGDIRAAQIKAFSWDRYHVTEYENSEYMFSVVITNAAGKIEAKISGDRVDSVTIVPLHNRNKSALLVDMRQMCTGGGRYTSYFFVKNHDLRNLAVIKSDRVAAEWPGVDGYPSLVADPTHTFNGSCDFIDSQGLDVPILYAWNGKYYTEAERRFPSKSLARAMRIRSSLQSDIMTAKKNGDTGRDLWYDVALDLAAYYVNMAEIGRSHEAGAWIATYVPKSVKQQFSTANCRPGLDFIISQQKYTSCRSDQKYYDSNEIATQDYWVGKYP